MRLLPSPLYAIVDAALATQARVTLPDLARALMRGGARVVQVRAKTLGSAAFLAACEEIVADARQHGAQVIVNDRADIAVLADAAGVHVGQEDLSVPAARRVVGDSRIVGVSTHDVQQCQAALQTAADYVAIGPVFETASKETGYDAVGLALVRQAAAHARGRPIVAIGGITLARARSVIDAGASCVAVISDLLCTGDPEARVREYLEVLG
jgi:thiamine-phosphate pyrophosphorylase